MHQFRFHDIRKQLWLFHETLYYVHFTNLRKCFVVCERCKNPKLCSFGFNCQNCMHRYVQTRKCSWWACKLLYTIYYNFLEVNRLVSSQEHVNLYLCKFARYDLDTLFWSNHREHRMWQQSYHWQLCRVI